MPFEHLGAGTKGLDDMEEHSYHGPEGCKVSLAGWEGTPETSVEEHSVPLDVEGGFDDEEEQALLSAIKEQTKILTGSQTAVDIELDPKLAPQTKSKEQLKKKALKAKQKHEAQCFSRRQLLSTVVTSSGQGPAHAKRISLRQC